MMQMSSNALDSVSAVLKNPRKERSDEEKRFDAIVASCTRKARGHRQVAKPKWRKWRVKRLYTITTLAASARYGGRRTVAVCDSFKKAQDIVLHNRGDIYEFSYSLCVIEAVACNHLYTHLDEAYWYKWYGDPNKAGSGYKAVHTPEAMKNTFGFAIG